VPTDPENGEPEVPKPAGGAPADPAAPDPQSQGPKPAGPAAAMPDPTAGPKPVREESAPPSLSVEERKRVEAAALAAKATDDKRRETLKRAGQAAVRSNLTIMAAAAMAMIGLVVFVAPHTTGDNRAALMYVVVAVMSGLVGYGELVSRYQDNPGQLIGARATPLYVIVNMAAGIAALGIVQTMHVFKTAENSWLNELLLAGFGSVAFFRTSLFTVRIGGNDVGIGPSALLQALLNAADRMVDRGQAEGRAEHVGGIMRDVDFAKARSSLPLFCIILVQNLTADDKKSLGDQINELNDAVGVPDETKAILLGVMIIRVVGPDVLERAVTALGDHIRKS